jgi:hypothetical protein
MAKSAPYDYGKLVQFATVRQLEYIEAIEKEGSHRKAAKLLKVNASVIDSSIRALRIKAALHSVDPGNGLAKLVDEPFTVKGTSTLVDGNGETKLTWIKTDRDAEKMLELMRATADGMKDELPREPVVEPPPSGNRNLCNTYVITDYHLGMLSWSEETGADWDIQIAENLLVKWFEMAIAQSPNAEQAVFAQLSDFLHFDGMDAVTPASKHLLDVDTRFPKLVRVAIRVLRRVIKMLLQKHARVHVIMADANHDPVSEIWMREWFAVLYEDEPRLTIDTSPNPYNVYEFGNVMLGFHHGHKRNVSNVSEVFVAQFREIYGRTKHCYIHTGHMHHRIVKENPMMIVEQHRTLAPADAYAARGGWLSGRDAQVITYSSSHGEVGRITINSDMVK